MPALRPMMRRLFDRIPTAEVRGRRHGRRRAHAPFERLEQRLALAITVNGVKWLDSNYNGIRDNELIQGDSPDVVFVVDVSISTGVKLTGDRVGDVNSDGAADNILDASLAGFIALNNYLKSKGVGDRARVSVVAFAASGEILDMDPSQPGVQTTARPNDDRDSNGMADVEQVLKGIKVGQAGIDGGGTNYEAALQKATAVFDELKTPAGVGNLIFLSDGKPNVPSGLWSAYSDEALALRNRGYNLRAFGANGSGVELAPLQVIDPVVGGAKPRPGAAIFNSTNELVAAFGGLRGDSTRYLEPGLAGVTIYVDLDNDGTLDPDEPRAVSRSDDPATVGVDETGWYSITTGIILPGDTYTVREIIPSGYLHTSLGTLAIPDPENPGATIRNQANGSWILHIPDGQSRSNIDFGNAPGAISGVKWYDANRNGIRDGSLIVGTNPDVVFVLDVSGSTIGTFGGTIPSQYVPFGNAPGDVNGDGTGNTVLDAEIAGFMALTQQLVDQGYGERARVSIVLFESDAVAADLDPRAGDQAKLVTNPTADVDANGIRDIDEVLRAARIAGGTDYEKALAKATQVFTTLGTPAGQGNLIFLSDGAPTNPGAHADEVATLAARGVNLRAFGAGDGAALSELQIIDKKAAIFRTTDELLTAFGSPQGGTASSATFSEPGMAWVTIYVDLNNNGVKDTGEPSAVTRPDDPATPNIDEKGSYTISGLGAGTYTVREVVPAGFIQTGGGNGRIDDGTKVRDGSWTVTIGEGSSARATDVNFGNAQAGVISGVKWRDDNRNGIRDGLLVQGEDPHVVFAIDVSGSVGYTAFSGTSVGDVNNDGSSNSVLDAELAGLIALTKQLVSLGYGSTAKVSVVVFGESAQLLGLPAAGGTRSAISPSQDLNTNGIPDIEEAIRSVRVGGATGGVEVGADEENFELALQQALAALKTEGTPAGQGNVILLSDGQLTGSAATAVFSDEVSALKAQGVNVRAFGAGYGTDLPTLKRVDPAALTFRNTDELLAAFGSPTGGSVAGAGSLEPGMAGVTIYIDLNENGVKDPGEPSTVTAADNPATKGVDEAGTYTFTGLKPGKYVVREVVPAGYVLRSTGTLGKFTYEKLSYPYYGSDGEPTNNANNNVDGSWTVYIGWNPVTWTETYYDSPNEVTDTYVGHCYETSATGIDFGNAPPAEIRGTKWLDRNGDGVRQTYGYDGSYIPRVIFAIDVSGSTWSKYAGCYVGDVNGDGKSNTILDAELYAILDLQQDLIDGGVGEEASISIVIYGSTAAFVDLDPVTAGLQTTVSPSADRNFNGISDLEEAVQGIREGGAGTVGVGTDHEAALQAIQKEMARLYGAASASFPPQRQVLFFSDGGPTEGGDVADEIASLATYSVSMKAFGVGASASLTALQKISASAAVYTSCSDLGNALDSYYPSVMPEPGLPGVVVYVDANENAKYDSGERWAVTRTDDPATPADETGTYSITAVPAGTWKVREIVPDGYLQTFPAGGGAHSVTIETAGLVRNVDFGNTPDPLAPVVNLPGPNLSAYVSRFSAVVLDPHATVDDASSETFATGRMRVFVSGGDSKGITFRITDQGVGTERIRVNGTQVLFNGRAIGVFAGGLDGVPLTVAFTVLATPRSTQALLRSITVEGVGTLTAGQRTVQVSVTDDTNRTSIARFKKIDVRPTVAPGAITGLTGTGASGSVTLAWSAPGDDGGTAITNYEIQYVERIGSAWSAYKTVARSPSTATAATVAGLTNDRAHLFLVRAVNAKGAGPWTTLSPAITPTTTPPAAISGLTATGANTKVTLSWTAPADTGGTPITNYEVTYSERTGTTWSAYKTATRTGSTATTATITGLTNGKQHLFLVRAVNAKGSGAWSAPSPTVIPTTTAPAAVTSLTATPLKASVRLNWAAGDTGGSPITNYEIQVATQTGGLWSAYTTVPRSVSTLLTATLTGLTAGKPHIYRVRAINTVGAGAWTTLTASVVPLA